MKSANKVIPKRIMALLMSMLLLSGFIFFRAVSKGTGNSRYEEAAGMRAATAPEEVTLGNDVVNADLTNMSKGYVAVKYIGINDNVKVRLAKEDAVNTYQIPTERYGDYVFLPLHAGDGEYELAVYEHQCDNVYSAVFLEILNVRIDENESPFLYPSLYVDYSEDSPIVEMARAIAETANSDFEVVMGVCYYITGGMKYDRNMEKQVKAMDVAFTAPDLDDVMISRKGLCADFATVMAAMLRSQGIPAKVVIGEVSVGREIILHAWVSVYLSDADEPGWYDADPSFMVTTGMAGLSMIQRGNLVSSSYIYRPDYCY